MSELLIARTQGLIGTIRLNRPAKLNAFTPEMYVALGQALDSLEKNQDVRVILISGEGRAFSAGFDITYETRDEDASERRKFIDEVANANRWKIWNSSKIVVAKVHGYCLGGAFELVMPADFTIVADDCILGEPDIALGIGPAFLMVPWIVSPAIAKAILLGGLRFRGSDAAKWGIVAESVAADDLDRRTEELVSRLISVPRNAARLLKTAINRAYDVRGMRAAIDAWVGPSVQLAESNDPRTIEFKRNVNNVGLKRALAARRKD